MTAVLVVSGQPLEPPVHGGRVRTASLARALARQLEVCVLAPGAAPDGLEHERLPDGPAPGRRSALASLDPAIGRALLPPVRREAVRAAVRRRRPDVVLLAQGAVAAMALPVPAAFAVDFHDVEVHRLASLARRGAPRKRLAWSWEYAKARRWEPRVARRAALAVAVSPRDAARLANWGAHVICVPHGADRPARTPSPPAGPVLLVGSMGYDPNLDGARQLLDEVWPRVRARRPDLRLRIVGAQAGRTLGRGGHPDGVEVVSDAGNLEPFYADASLVVAPTREGGGAQVKVAEALARGRVVIASPFSLLSAPTGASGAVLAAGTPERFAELVVRLWEDLDERRALERLLDGPVVPSWDEVVRPLVAEVRRIAGHR